MNWTFEAEVFPWDEEGPSWRFARVPDDVADDIRAQAAPSRSGTVRVEATIGSTTWTTSLFPVKEPPGFLLAVKASVRKAERVDDGGGTARWHAGPGQRGNVVAVTVAFAN